MTTNVDWRREIDASFGESPISVDRAAVMATGRRTVRRRRTVRVGGALGVAALGSILSLQALAPSSSPVADGAEADRAVQSEADPAGQSAGQDGFRQERFINRADSQAYYDEAGQLVVRDDAVLLERLGVTEGVASDFVAEGLVTEYKGREMWTYIVRAAGDPTSIAARSEFAAANISAGTSLSMWLRDQAVAVPGDFSEQGYVGFDRDGNLAVAPGVEVLGRATQGRTTTVLARVGRGQVCISLHGGVIVTAARSENGRFVDDGACGALQRTGTTSGG